MQLLFDSTLEKSGEEFDETANGVSKPRAIRDEGQRPSTTAENVFSLLFPL